MSHQQQPYGEPWPPQTSAGPGGDTVFRGRRRTVTAHGGGSAPVPRKRRRVFLWVFLAVQVLFLIWVITGAASGGSIHSGAVAYCHAHPDQYLPFSECVSDYGGGAKVGTAAGVGLIVLLWAVVDVILGVSYGVWRLARR